MLSPTAKILQLGQSFMTKYDKVLVVKAIFFYRKLQVLNGKSKKYHDFLISKKKKDSRAIQDAWKSWLNFKEIYNKNSSRLNTYKPQHWYCKYQFPLLFIYLFIYYFFFFFCFDCLNFVKKH